MFKSIRLEDSWAPPDPEYLMRTFLNLFIFLAAKFNLPFLYWVQVSFFFFFNLKIPFTGAREIA